MNPGSKNKDRLQIFWSTGRQKRQKGFRFLDLPEEIRNQIYSYVYDDSILLDLNGKSSDIKDVKIPEAEKTIVFGIPLGRYRPIRGTFKKSTTVSAFYLCNRQISNECLAYLYGQVILMSRQTFLSIAFFDTVRESTSQHLRHLQLHHSTYGDPKLFEYVKYKTKSDRKWALTCLLAVNHLPNLTHLCINICINDKPFRFNLNEKWVQPLLYFTYLEHLKTVEVHVFSPWRRATSVDSDNLRLWQNTSPQHVRELIQNHHGNVEMHELFGVAIAKKILGFCNDCAMEELVEAINDKWSSITHQPYWEEWIRK